MMSGQLQTTDRPKPDRQLGLLLVLPLLFTFAAKPALLFVSNWQEWLAVDYLLRILFLAYVILVPRVREVAIQLFRRAWSDKSGPLRLMTFITVVLAAVMAEIFINQIRPPIYALFPETEFFNYFEIENQFWLIFDLTIGLTLVAISEEIMFRGFVIRFLGIFTSRAALAVLMSAVVFGLVHWTNGADNVVAATLTGLVLGSIYMHSRSLWPCILIHYLINLGYFWPN